MKITIMRPTGLSEERELNKFTDPNFGDLRALLDPILEDHLEHVTVLHEGERRDMFVGECSALGDHDRNEAATAIYRNNWLTQHPEEDPESLPAIYGPAVLFHGRVWR
jgi:hypothetical protein